VIDYEIIVLDPELIYQHSADDNVLLERRPAKWKSRNRSTIREKSGGLTQLLALEQSVAAPVLCSRKILIGR
jgi:hypothetical protein